MKYCFSIVFMLLLASFTFGAKTQPQKIQGENGDIYVIPPQEVLSNWGLHSEYVLIPKDVPAEVTVLIRNFKEEIFEFKDKEEMERGNDEN